MILEKISMDEVDRLTTAITVPAALRLLSYESATSESIKMFLRVQPSAACGWLNITPTHLHNSHLFTIYQLYKLSFIAFLCKSVRMTEHFL